MTSDKKRAPEGALVNPDGEEGIREWTPREFVFRYVQWHRIAEFEAQGWVVSAELGPTHGCWSVLMELPPDRETPAK